MSLLQRLYNFLPGQTIQSAQANAELNQIVDALSGVSTTKNILMKYSHATESVLGVDQTGAGIIQEWKLSGSQKLRVNNSGQLESLITTGTAPFIAVSTTKCTNLNADLLDGVEGAQFARVDASNSNLTVLDSGFTIVDNSDNTKALAFEVSGISTGTLRTWTIQNSNDTFVGRATTDTLTNKTIVGYPRTLNVNTTPVGNITTGLDNLQSYSVPAGTLAANNDFLIIRASGSLTANDNNKRVNCTFGGQNIISAGAVDIDGGSWNFEVVITRLTSTTCRYSSRMGYAVFSIDSANSVSTFGTGASGDIREGDITVSDMGSNALIFQVLGEGTNTDDVISRMLIVQVVKMT